MSIAEAYDTVATQYDALLRRDQWMRQMLWARYQHLFRAGQHVLDLGCGTGLDTVFLAQQGIDVTAVDISPGMIAQLKRKAAQRDLSGSIDTAVLDAAQNDAWPAGSFDGLIAAFAVLNTFPDLTQFAAQAAAHLQPGGRLLLHLLNGRSLWEWSHYLLQGRWTAARQLKGHSVRSFQVNGQAVPHYLHDPRCLYQSSFAAHFQLSRSYGLGIWHPPHLSWSAVSRGLAWWEGRLGGKRPFKYWGRFFVLELVKPAMVAEKLG